MNRMRISLFYLGSYLTIIGFGLLLVPHETLKILQSNGEYDDVFPRVAGMLMSGLGLSIFGIIRSRASELYPATLFIRVYFIGCIAAFRAQRNNRGLRRSLKTRTEKLLSDVLVLTRLPPLLENGCVEKAISPLVLMAVVRRESYGPQPASSNIAVNNHTVAPDWTPYIAGPYRAAHG